MTDFVYFTRPNTPYPLMAELPHTLRPDDTVITSAEFDILAGEYIRAVELVCAEGRQGLDVASKLLALGLSSSVANILRES